MNSQSIRPVRLRLSALSPARSFLCLVPRAIFFLLCRSVVPVPVGVVPVPGELLGRLPLAPLPGAEQDTQPSQQQLTCLPTNISLAKVKKVSGEGKMCFRINHINFFNKISQNGCTCSFPSTTILTKNTSLLTLILMG